MAKGYQHKPEEPELATVDFAPGHRMHGLEIRVRLRVPVGVILGAVAGDVSRAMKPFLKQVESWNLEDADGNPVPFSLEAFEETFDTGEAGEILAGWVQSVAGLTTPLVEPSSASAISANGSSSMVARPRSRGR